MSPSFSAEFLDALPFQPENENHQANTANNMSNPTNQSNAAEYANQEADTRTFGSRLSAGPPHLGSYGNPTDSNSQIKTAQYQLLRLFTHTFNPDTVRSDERPLVAMHWVHSLKRHLTPLKEVPYDQMLVFIYTLLEGSADIASFNLSQRPDVTVEVFFEWFEARYCQGTYGVSILDELQSLKQTGPLQDYVARATQLQAYNEFTPAPATAKVFKEYFIRGLQNTALQRQLRTIRFSPAEIANGDEVPEIMREAERLVREGVYAEFVNARPNATTNQIASQTQTNRVNGQNRGSSVYGSNRNPGLAQGYAQPMYPRVPMFGRPQFPPTGSPYGNASYQVRNQGHNSMPYQRPGQGQTYKPPHLRTNQYQSRQPVYQQSNAGQQNSFVPNTALKNYDAFGNQRSVPESDDMQLDALSFANPFGPQYVPQEYYDFHPGYANVPYGLMSYYGDVPEAEHGEAHGQADMTDQGDVANPQFTTEYPKAEGQH